MASPTRRERLGALVSSTPRKVLAVAAAIGTIAGAVAGVKGLLPAPTPPRPVMSAKFESVTDYPEVSLEEYDAHAHSAVGAAGDAGRTASVGGTIYRLAAYRPATDTTSVPNAEQKSESSTTEQAPEAPGTTTPSSPTGTSEAKSSESRNDTPSGQTKTTDSTPSEKPPATSPEGPNRRKRTKRPGARIRLTSPNAPYPKEEAKQPQITASPPSTSLHPVKGAVVSEGAGVAKPEIGAVVQALAASPAHEAQPEGAEPSSGAELPATGGPESSETETSTGASPGPSAPPPVSKGAHEALTPRLVLPKRCHTGTCGATQEIERALTYDPNPVKAAQAVAALFNDSRSEIVDKRLYPIGAKVSYNLRLEGFAHREVTLEWSLIGKAHRRPLPRPWWRNIVVAHVKPDVEDESLGGEFWVPIPPERGNYLVHLVLLDANGVAHATGDTTPTFH